MNSSTKLTKKILQHKTTNDRYSLVCRAGNFTSDAKLEQTGHRTSSTAEAMGAAQATKTIIHGLTSGRYATVVNKYMNKLFANEPSTNPIRSPALQNA